MRFVQRFVQVALLLFAVIASTSPAVASTRTRRRPASSKVVGRHAAKPKAQSRLIGQRTIDDGRASQIQTALIKAGYLSGEPSGHWDAESQGAMEKLQADHGWQTKLVPDSRALINLGLGPTMSSNNAPGSRAVAPGPSQPGTLTPQ